MQYLAYAQETCPTTDRKHWQGWCYGDKMTFTKWKDILPEGCHFEMIRGSFADNEAYCSKEGQLIEHGVKPMENGKKRTFKEFKEELDAGERPEKVARKDEKMFQVYVQYTKGLEKYAEYIRREKVQEDREKPDVYVRIGPAGTGKTRWLDDTFGLDGWVFAPDNTGRWFDGCDRDVICFDDVEAGQIPPLSLWKRLCDRYPMQVPVKGGFITWKPKTIVFTSNSHPKEWWKDMSQFDIDAVERRITEIVVVE